MTDRASKSAPGDPARPASPRRSGSPARRPAATTGRALLGFVLILAAGAAQTGMAAVQKEPLETRWRTFLEQGAAGADERHFPYRECFRRAAAAQGLPEALLLAVARGESAFDPSARSSADAYGLMQIRWPGTARHLGIHRLSDLLDPCTNVDAGSRYLKELLARYDGNLHRALAAYNYGPGRVPVGSDRIPAGAALYSAYIWRHLTRVRERPGADPGPASRGGSGSGRLAVIRFSREYRASAFAAWLEAKLEGIPVEWKRRQSGGFDVLMLYEDREELKRGKALLSRLGIGP